MLVERETKARVSGVGAAVMGNARTSQCSQRAPTALTAMRRSTAEKEKERLSACAAA